VDFGFTRWSQYYLRGRSSPDHELKELSLAARELAMARPIDEWRSNGAGMLSELAAFFDQAEELLASNDENHQSAQ
jgi:hypothetical protein